MVILGYFTHFHESALCYTDVHVYRTTSLDLSKAFDTVTHIILLCKLYAYGIQEIPYNNYWFENYLHQHTQYVKI